MPKLGRLVIGGCIVALLAASTACLWFWLKHGNTVRDRSSPQRVENELRNAILRSDFVVIDHREDRGLRECICVYDRKDLTEIAQSLVVLNEIEDSYETPSLMHLYVEGGGSPMRVTMWTYALYPGDHHDKDWEAVNDQHGWETDPSFWDTLWAKLRRTLTSKRDGVRPHKSAIGRD